MVRVSAPTSFAVKASQALARARAEGVKLRRVGGQYFAQSVGNPDVYYWLDEDGCTCPGFFRTGCCKHFAAYLSATGQLPALDDPAPVPVPVPQLGGLVAVRISEAMSQAAITYMADHAVNRTPATAAAASADLSQAGAYVPDLGPVA